MFLAPASATHSGFAEFGLRLALTPLATPPPIPLALLRLTLLKYSLDLSA